MACLRWFLVQLNAEIKFTEIPKFNSQESIYFTVYGSIPNTSIRHLSSFLFFSYFLFHSNKLLTNQRVCLACANITMKDNLLNKDIRNESIRHVSIRKRETIC